MFSKILVANRGEIALRVIRTAREMAVGTVAVYSEADRCALHVVEADEAVCIGGPPSNQSYLRGERIIAEALRLGAEAVHPGYGFLAENADFARACEGAGLVFIGPSAEVIESLGSKTNARRIMQEAGVPVVPGSGEAVEDPGPALEQAREIGFPVMIKAAAGGGGKGMRLIYEQRDLPAALEAARREAAGAFASAEVYIEKYLEEPHHIEVQVLADAWGNVIHLGERECSIQRRHQKVVEESPSPFVTQKLRRAVCGTAVRAASAAGYVNAGTVEFLVDRHRKHYFLEMNTRLQVEHPVTELVTGVDLVREQLRVAAGEELSCRQEDIHPRGHAIECRICAEDPLENFLPDSGLIHMHRLPDGPGVRVDSGVRRGSEVSVHYDPLLAKLVCWAADRPAAIARMLRALGEYRLHGVRNNIDFCRWVMEHEEFRAGEYSTHFIDRHYDPAALPAAAEDEQLAAEVAEILQDARLSISAQLPLPEAGEEESPHPAPAVMLRDRSGRVAWSEPSVWAWKFRRGR